MSSSELEETAVRKLWNTFTLEYFLTHSPNAIERHSEAILATPAHELPLIQMRQTAKRGGTEVLFYGIDRDNLFAVITTLLDQLALSIVNARVMSTSAGFSLNSFLVLEQDGNPVEAGQRWDEIIATLREGLTQEGDQPLRVNRSIPRRHKHFDTTTQVYFNQEPKLHRTAMRLVTLDRPGLLSDVGQAFASCEIRLQHAKITTLGAEVEDIFFITDRNNEPIEDNTQLECLKAAVTARIPE